MTDEDVAWYRRLLDSRPELLDVACWTVVQPLTGPVTVAEVVRRLGGDPAGIGPRTGWDFEDLPVVHLHQAGPAVVMVEPDGDQGVRDEALRWLSDGAAVHGSWWGEPIGRSLLCYAAFGRVLTRLEHLDTEHPDGDAPTALDEDRAALRDLPGDLDYPAQLALVERRTGVRLDPAWLDEPHQTVLLRTPRPADPRPPGLLAAADPDLAAVLLLATERARREAVRWVLSLLADEHGLRDEPSAGEVLDALVDSWPTGEELLQRCRAVVSRRTQELNASPGGSPERWRHYYRLRAAEAFAATVLGDYDRRAEPVDTLWYAQQALPERWPDLRAELWRRLRAGRA